MRCPRPDAAAPWLIAVAASALTIATAARPVRVDVHVDAKPVPRALVPNRHPIWKA